MANTKAQVEAERWIVTEYLPMQFNQQFKEKPTDLTWGGKFKFDAVSKDGKIIANISTSTARTAQGKQAIGKFQKIKSDTLYLLHANSATKRLQIFTEKDMREHFIREKESGRFPPEVDLIHVELPDKLKQKLQKARQLASKEVTPNIQAVSTE
jgi:hypothetical protein